MAHVLHEFLREGVEARAYQLRSLERILSFSTLMVMPTGFGKTAVQWMAMAEFLRTGSKKIILIAPTTGLVEQQATMARERLRLEPEHIVTYTGSTPPDRRKKLWESATILMATPQVIRNDVTNGIVDLTAVDLLIMDEAHHATGNHAYAQVGIMYQRQHPEGRVLAATASPGSNMRTITEVQKNLNTNNLDLSKRQEALMLPYDVDMDIHLHRLQLPDTLLTLLEPIKSHFDSEVAHLQQLGFLPPKEHIGTRDIEKAQQSTSRAIQQRDVRGYDAARRVADLRRLHILMNLLQTQGTSVAKDFLDRAEEEGRSGRKTNRMLALPVVHQLRLALKDIGELHPKGQLVESLVRQELQMKPEGKVLIFTEYRDSVHRLSSRLGSYEELRPDVFIGQSSRGSQKGMTQKEQLAQLERFRGGEINVLVATSVGEEGLDVPAADLVVLYEPVPSAVRAIQRRGRTARQRAGSVHMLVTNDTRDAYVQRASEQQEANMHRLLQRLVDQRTFKQSFNHNHEALNAFTIVENDLEEPAKSYLDRAVAEAPKEDVVSEKPARPVRREARKNDRVAAPLTPDQLRSKHQANIFDFHSHQSSNTQRTTMEQQTTVILNAADREIVSLNTVNGRGRSVQIDHREGKSTLPGYLSGLGFNTTITQLPCGDIRLSERILIERKTARDLLASIKTGTLLKQCRSLKASAVRPLLLIETGGESSYGLHPNAVLGALAHITLDLGVPVMMVKDAKEAAHFLAVAAQREHDALERLHDFARRHEVDEEKVHDALEEARAALEDMQIEPEEPHPWFDSAFEHLERCFAYVLDGLGPMGDELVNLAKQFTPDIGKMLALDADGIVEQTGCSMELAETWVRQRQRAFKSQ